MGKPFLQDLLAGCILSLAEEIDVCKNKSFQPVDLWDDKWDDVNSIRCDDLFWRIINTDIRRLSGHHFEDYCIVRMIYVINLNKGQ